MARNPKRASRAEIDFAHTLADLAAEAVLPYFRQPLAVRNKATRGGFDPVTAADEAAERVIRAAIGGRYPDHGIVGEESAATIGSGRHRWVIDPIDGTRAFIMGSPLWGTLIGLMDGPTPILGLMSQPFTRERFWSDGATARWRGPDGKARAIATRACARLSEAVLTSTHPDLFSRPGEMAAFERVKSRARMTRFGGDCYGYCLLAAGFVDLVVEAGLAPYDIVALIPIIEAAGGVITTWTGEPATEGGNIVAAGNPRVHAEALALLAGGAAKKR